MMTPEITAMIIDDERLARNNLRIMLATHPRVRVIGEADSVGTAVERIHRLKPGLLFLDIQMPGESGFDLLARLKEEVKVIFITAHDEHAIRAFEVNALDYLLKPVHPDRLATAIERVLRLPGDIPKHAKPLDYDDRLLLTLDGRAVFLKINQIAAIRAAGTYSEIITRRGKKALVLKSLLEWDQRLPDKNFVRIHRSTIINFDALVKVELGEKTSCRVYLRDQPLPFTMSRRYAARLKERFA